MGSSPTPGALVVDSYEDLNNLNKDKINDSLQNSPQLQDNISEQKRKIINELIISICKYQRSFIKKSLDKLLEISPSNTEIICKYIIAEQNEINIKESTKEGKIKTLIELVKFLDFKDISEITKEDISHILTGLENQKMMMLIIDGSEHGIINIWFYSSSLGGYMIKIIRISRIENILTVCMESRGWEEKRFLGTNHQIFGHQESAMYFSNTVPQKEIKHICPWP